MAERAETVGLLLGREVVRSYGDVAAEYSALRETVGVIEREDLRCGRMWGRDPQRMLNGLLTNDLAALDAETAVYGAVLTPKGRIIADLVIYRASEEEVRFLFPAAALEGLTEHLKKYVPPMFARWEILEDHRVLGIYGPRSAEVVEQVFGTSPRGGMDSVTRFGDDADSSVLGSALPRGGGGFEVVVEAGPFEDRWEAAVGAAEAMAGRAVGFDALEIVRVEDGLPRWGNEITEESLPAEVYQPTGLMERAVSFSKGCYTGQEVVVRIAHRGHVNRRIQGLRFGASSGARPGNTLHRQGADKVMGEITSVVESPRFGRIGLASVRREIAVGDDVHIGEPDGAIAKVAALPFEAA